jgi:alkylmercury lyase
MEMGMDQQKLTKIKEGFRAAYDQIPAEAMELDLQVTVQTIQLLSEGNPVPAERLAEVWGMPQEQVEVILDQASSIGKAQLDGEGRLVGGVLSLLPTEHKVRVNDNDLYAWCAYDAVFIPGVIGKTARIESRDPVNGEIIRMTITPDGVIDLDPTDSVISVVNPDMGDAGPDGPRCSQMLFFSSRKSAGTWQKDHPDVEILTVEEVFEIAQEFEVGLARRLGLIE